MCFSKWVLLFAILVSTQQVLARDMDMSMDPYNKSCVDLTNACIAADYDSKDTGKRQFWRDCMKPLLLGQSVKGVIVNSQMTGSCRTAKINDLQKELAEFQSAAKS